MTQADSATALRRSLDSKPITGQGPAKKITAATPLPDGWTSFCSKPNSENLSHWYATAPWNVGALQEQYGEAAADLLPTVDADTWARLHVEVATQVELYESLTGEQV
jgi:hypothetical protein